MIHRHLLPAFCLLAAVTTACAGRETASSPTPQPPAAPGPAAVVVPQPPPGPPVSPEEALRASVTRFWDARLKDDVALQYHFLEPEAKERVTLTAYVRSRGAIMFLAYVVKGIGLTEDKSWVTIMYTFKLNMPQLAGFGPWTETNPEVWVLRGGIWYRSYDQKEAHTPPLGVTIR